MDDAYDARLMRILHLAWEYPPVLYGGLGRHVHALANAQAANGHDVVVITQASGPGAPTTGAVEDSDSGPVRVLRAGDLPTLAESGDLLGQVTLMEQAFTACGEDLLGSWSPDVVHAHDWMVAHAAVSLRAASGAPLVATIHATEAGRNQGWVTTELSTTIHSIEWWLANTADAVIACSRSMDDEIACLFGVHATRVVANGIDLSHWTPPNGASERMRAAHADARPLLAYTGRMEWEKGVQLLLQAMPALRQANPDVRLLVAGRGSYLPQLQEQARELGLDHCTRFLGWVSEEDLRAVVAVADVAIAPSLYEPFGLVALEAAALGTPVVVSETGGLAEFAGDGERALTFRPGDVDGLARAVQEGLDEPAAARERAQRAADSLTDQHDWRRIARATVEVYLEAETARSADASAPFGGASRYRRELAQPRFEPPLGRLLDRGW